jgi:hypothetical protein
MAERSAQRGWIMALSYSTESAWGDVEEFFDNVRAPRGEDTWEIRSEVWGKTLRKDWNLARRDGIAFYHTKRARFHPRDPGRGKARISLIGNITEVSQEGQHVSYLSSTIRASDFESLRGNPVLRDDSSEHLFRAAGMIPGTVATYYLIPPDAWAEIMWRVRGTSNSSLSGDILSEDEEAFGDEGALLLRTHLTRERDPQLIKRKKQQILEAEGRLACEICQFDFERRYGRAGSGVCEVHHRTPLSQRTDAGIRTRLEDLAIVCANCHRMLHKPETQCSMEIVRDLLR